MTSPELLDKPATPSANVRPTRRDEDVGADRPSGPAAAAVLAAGVACFALGLLSILEAASGSVSDVLTLSDRVGFVSGLSTLTSATFFVVWGALAVAWRRSDPPLARVAAVTGLLVGLGLLGTFPPIFNAIGG